MKSTPALVLLVAGLAVSVAAAEPSPAFPVSVSVDPSKTIGELKPIWRFFGADEPNYAYMKDGSKLLSQLGELRPHAIYFRAHNLLTSGDGTPALKWGSTNAYTEDAQGRPVYNWTILDRIFDTYLARGLRPYVEIGFMPQALSPDTGPYQHAWGHTKDAKLNTGWAWPPKDYAKWGELVYQWTRHCVDRYGRAEVEQWYWEVWNEANIPPYWNGTPEEFLKMHDYAIAGVRRALPTARVGGPDSAGPGGKFMQAFLDHALHGANAATGATGGPLDFISFHAKGQPSFVDGHVRMGLANQLRNINDAFALIASVPEMKARPIVIGECDPDGCAACRGPQLGYRNTTMYSSYTAASFGRIQELADRHGVNIEGALTWAFTFEDQPWFAGFRQLASNGVAMPVLNTFRLFAKMAGQRVAVVSSGRVATDDIIRAGVRGQPDVSGFAAVEPHRLSLLLWHYHDDDVPGPDAAVSVALSGVPATARVTHYRIDHDHSNAYTAWVAMGSPASPTAAQVTTLEAASALATVEAPALSANESGQSALTLTLPRQAVSLLVFDW
ncbi:MAG TPA: beta-xylosidase [Lacunisphaera sp.]|nr:beta-xylosidase [Lacunisphaera sp.]